MREAKKDDVGKCIARVDRGLMKELNVPEGGILVLSGKRKTPAIARQNDPDDEGKGVIRIDGFTRKNAGVAIGGFVTISQTEAKNARGMVLAPIDMRLNVDEDFINFVKNRLSESVMTKGDTILVMMLGHAIPFTVVRATPDSNALYVSIDTRLTILNEPVGEKEKDLMRKVTQDFRMLLRHDWLKVVSSRVGASRTIFSIVDTDKVEENEDRILDQAKTLTETNLQPANIIVSFLSEKGEHIGSLPWLEVDIWGETRPRYPDISIPPHLDYTKALKGEMRVSASAMRRCFKTGLQECPKEIAFSPKMVFVAMPFRPDFQDLYKYAIRPALEEMGFKIWKADEKISNIDIMCKICQGIQESSYIIANISDWNPNVLFEMGLAYGIGRNVVLIKNRKERVPVDLKGLEYIDYEDIDELKRNIINFFKSAVERSD